MIDSIVLLGSTGSIGVNTLSIAKRFNLRVEALVAGGNIELLNRQIEEFNPKFVAISKREDIPRVNHNRIYFGADGILELLNSSNSPLVVNALVGYVGLSPTIEAIRLNRRVALANKESLVVAGEFIDTSKIVPIDSEHFGLYYLIGDREFKKLYITASGGAFRDWDIEDIKNASFADALKHPNWSMGDKITIDSATMTNKLFELLEAKWLFNTENIDAFIEKKSIIHALVEFRDGSTTAHLAGVDMKLPIAFAIEPNIKEEILEPVNLLEIGSLEFLPIKENRYPIWQIKNHILKNPHLGVVLNASNEEAISMFKRGECSFFGMSEIVLDAYKKFEKIKPNSIEDIIKIDREVRDYIAKK